jgi:hypothetical protein
MDTQDVAAMVQKIIFQVNQVATDPLLSFVASVQLLL